MAGLSNHKVLTSHILLYFKHCSFGCTVDDELVKCVRMQTPPSNEKEYTLQVLSGVRFAPLVKKPGMKTVIRANVWSPTSHLLYPDTFRKACEQILLCSQFASKNANVGSSSKSGKPTNAASLLPRAMWIEVLKFCTRDCKIIFLWNVYRCFYLE